MTNDGLVERHLSNKVQELNENKQPHSTELHQMVLYQTNFSRPHIIKLIADAEQLRDLNIIPK